MCEVSRFPLVLLNFSVIPLRSENVFGMSSIFNFVDLFCERAIVWSTVDHVLGVLEKKVCCAASPRMFLICLLGPFGL